MVETWRGPKRACHPAQVKRPLSALLVSFAVAAPGCTLIVWRDAATPAPCDDDVDCPADEACVDGSCDVVDPGAVPADGTAIDIAGGVVSGPDGVELEVPAGAVSGETVFFIRKETSTLPRDNFAAEGGFYAVSPTVTFAIPALLRLPGDDDEAFLRPIDDDLEWQPLIVNGERFELPRAGVVARGQTVTP